MEELVRSGTHVVLRLPSEVLKLIQIQPNTSISLGKFGTFQANHLIGRPFHATYEILDKPLKDGASNLRIVPASELHEAVLAETDSPGEVEIAGSGDYEVVNEEGKVVMRTNQHIKDDGVSQKLTPDEIEALKKADISGGKDIISKLLESHSTLDQKTTFSLAKYTLRKTKKYMRRFTVLPVDLPLLVEYLFESKDAPRIMDMREETLSLMMSYANVHWSETEITSDYVVGEDAPEQTDKNRWLVVDELSGLLVAALAERMGILYPLGENPIDDEGCIGLEDEDIEIEEVEGHVETAEEKEARILEQKRITKLAQEQRIFLQEQAMSGTSNHITLVHQNVQPNLSLLTYFGYDVSNPDWEHPLYVSLKEISFLQLVSPEDDYAYQEPPRLSEEQLKTMKSRQKSAYYRKRRRWERTKAIVDVTQEGEFAGLVVASIMAPASILHRLVPLLRGGAQVVVYSPTVEPLTELLDCYSKGRRSAYAGQNYPNVPSEEFPVDPRLLIGTALHTTRSRPWQVLPGRTHPMMSGRGGSEGYIFVGTRVHPIDGKVEARGANKKRKIERGTNGSRLTAENGHPEDSIPNGVAEENPPAAAQNREGEPDIKDESMQIDEQDTKTEV